MSDTQRHSMGRRQSSSSLIMRQTSGSGIDAFSLESDSLVSFSNGEVIDVSPPPVEPPRASTSNASSIRSNSMEDAPPKRRSTNDNMSKFVSKLTNKFRNNSATSISSSRKDSSDSSESAFSPATVADMLAPLAPPPPPATRRMSLEVGRARNLTIDHVRRSSFLAVNRIKSEDELHGARRNSVRLSEADVGFLLGRVNKISPETLRQAAKDGNAQLCEALVRGGVDVNCGDEHTSRTPLMLAVEAGKSDTAHHLLDLGAAVDQRDSEGHTALWLAIEMDKMSCVQFLLSSGADGNLPVDLKPAAHSIFTQVLVELEDSLINANEQKFAVKSEVCRIFLQDSREFGFHREQFKPSTLFLVDEWMRASKAGEVLVVPPIAQVIEGETHLLRFLKQHRRRVSIFAVIKIWFVVMFIVFDLASRDMQMTPQRLLTYAFLYVGAYYL